MSGNFNAKHSSKAAFWGSVVSMKKAVKWLVLGIFILSSIGFGIPHTSPGADNPFTPGGAGCKSAVARNTTGCK